LQPLIDKDDLQLTIKKEKPMATSPVPLSVVSSLNDQYYFGQIAIGDKVLEQNPSSRSLWFVVIDRSDLSVVFNELQSAPNTVPALTKYNNSDHILIVATMGMGLNNQPQGDLFNFLDHNGGGIELRRIEQVATQFNCGSLGTYGYALVGVMGDQDIPGFEASIITAPSTGPILTLQLMPTVVNGKTSYTPVSLNNA
jgi:hypothetical protein